MTSAAAWRWCLAAGLIAFACSFAFGLIPGMVACGSSDGLGPIIAFELAQTPADVAALFGTEPCRSTLVAAQRNGLWLDALGFIPAYTAFLSFAAWAAGGRRAWPLIAGLLVAGLCDEVEGVLLFATLRALPGVQPALDVLFWAVHAKFLLLAFGTAGIGGLLIARHGSVPKLFGIVAVVGAILALSGLLRDPVNMMSGFAIGWVAILVAAALASWRPALFAPASATVTPDPRAA